MTENIGEQPDDDLDEGLDVEDDEVEDESTQETKKASRPSLSRAHRQAARFRIEAKTERTRADTAEQRADAAEERERALLTERAFVRAAGDRFADLDAAWKLADRQLMKVEHDGSVTGADEAVEALIDNHPFILAADQTNGDDKRGDNPFRPLTSGSPMTGKRRPRSEPNAAMLARKYPALRNR